MEEITYMHLDTGKGGKVTAAIKLDNEFGYTRACVGLAFCCPKDQFNKRIGRTIAKGRLDKDKVSWELTVNPKTFKKEVKEHLVYAIECQDPSLPTAWTK